MPCQNRNSVTPKLSISGNANGANKIAAMMPTGEQSAKNLSGINHGGVRSLDIAISLMLVQNGASSWSDWSPPFISVGGIKISRRPPQDLQGAYQASTGAELILE